MIVLSFLEQKNTLEAHIMESPIIAIDVMTKLLDEKPSSWRRLLVPVSIRYDQLHVIMQLVYG